jgi:2-polyprenyl-6-methoxyphenol hydroxylase-like FAD-dependent oxidoreductase
MADIVIIGGGIAGLTGALLLARDGHHVTVLERDPAPPPADPRDAWDEWERRGVTQFRLSHAFLPRFRALLDAELPDVPAALVAAGALRSNRLASLPDTITGGWRDGDERFEVITGRRPTIEATLALLVDTEPGVVVRRGVATRGLLVDHTATTGIPDVTGVVTDTGERLPADLVVDAGGRRSALPELLVAAGARRPVDERADSGFVYYARHFRSPDGEMPFAFGPPLQHYESVSFVTAVADNGHWSVTLTAAAGDVAMRAARRVEVWERIVRSYPLIAHWIDAEPITGVDTMAGIEDRIRRFAVEGRPVATGVAAVGDAWACTNPSVGRGASLALLHAVCLRDVVRTVGTDDRQLLAHEWEQITTREVEPLVDDTLRFDRHRLAEIEAQIAGRRYGTDDPGWALGQALGAAAGRDPDLLRAMIDLASLYRRTDDLLADAVVGDRLQAVSPGDPPPGPTRAQLVEIIAGRAPPPGPGATLPRVIEAPCATAS